MSKGGLGIGRSLVHARWVHNHRFVTVVLKPERFAERHLAPFHRLAFAVGSMLEEECLPFPQMSPLPHSRPSLLQSLRKTHSVTCRRSACLFVSCILLPFRGTMAILWEQIKMVLYKNWLLKKRSKCASCCEILVPMIVMGVMVFGFKLSSDELILANNYDEIFTLTGPTPNITGSGRLSNLTDLFNLTALEELNLTDLENLTDILNLTALSNLTDLLGDFANSTNATVDPSLLNTSLLTNLTSDLINNVQAGDTTALLNLAAATASTSPAVASSLFQAALGQNLTQAQLDELVSASSQTAQDANSLINFDAAASALGPFNPFFSAFLSPLNSTVSDIEGNTTSLEATREALCTSLGVCFVGNVEQMNLLNQFSSDLFALLNGVIPVLPLDAFFLIQLYSQDFIGNGTAAQLASFIPALQNTIKQRKLAFAPNTAQVRDMVNQLNNSNIFFNRYFYRIFESEEEGVRYSINEGADELWALIVVDDLDPANNLFEYTIRMNQTATPNTRRMVDKFAKGRARHYQEYILSGFPTLQHMLDSWFLGVRSSGLGTSCPLPPGLRVDLDAPAGLAGQLNNLLARSLVDGLLGPALGLGSDSNDLLASLSPEVIEALLLLGQSGSLNSAVFSALTGISLSNLTSVQNQSITEIQALAESVGAPSAVLSALASLPDSVLQNVTDALINGVNSTQNQSAAQLSSIADVLAAAIESAYNTTNSTNLTALIEPQLDLLVALFELLPDNFTGSIPGLVDANGQLDPTMVQRVVNILSSGANAATLVMPVKDFDENPFFLFASAFVGLVGVYAYLYPLSINIRTIAQEKEVRIKQGMLIMGLYPMAMYLAWLISCVLVAIITAVLLTIEMKMTFLQYVSPSLMLVLNLLFALTTVAFAFICSTLFSKARLAAIVGPLLLFICTVPAFTVPPESPSWVHTLVSLLSPVAFCNAMDIVASYEQIKIGASWSIINEGEKISILTCLVMLIFDFFLYLLLAWYLDQVLPSAHGVTRHPLFCLPLRLRKMLICGKADEGSEYQPDADLLETVPPELEGLLGVDIQNLRKVFPGLCSPSNVAVDGLNLKMYEGQISVILGHNGAGKTTTINMLTGITPPTAGNCAIYGQYIRSNMKDIRKSTGLCPQHNILWDKLSVAEHLRFYARLKGLRGHDADEAIRTTMHDIGLQDKAAAWSMTLSGGMKRRLSVGIALIGGSKVVFLDEPTSGMDPVARRQTWDLLRRAKEGRVLVLTTHFMDEADLLGDRIAIMSKGKLRCCGSPLFLKSRLGVGYILSFELKENAQRQAIRSCVTSHAPTSSSLSEVAGECQFKLPMCEARGFPGMFAMLEARRLEWGIRSFGLSLTTIEEVFMKIAAETEGENQQIKRHRLRFWKGYKKPPPAAAEPGMPRVQGMSTHNLMDITVDTEDVVPSDGEGGRPAERSEGVPAMQVDEDEGLPPGKQVPQTAIVLEVEEDMPPAKVLVDDASSDDSPLPLVKPLPLPEYDLGTSPSSPVAEDSESAVPAAELEAKAAGRRERVMNSGLMVKGQQVTGCSLFLRQLQASFMKRVHCAKRDRKTICLQIFMPVAVIIIALALLNIVGPEKPPLELQLTGYTDDVQLTARECGWAADAQYFPTDGVEYDIMDVDDGVGKTEELDKTYYGQGTQYRLGSVLYKDEVLRVQAVNVSGFPTISFHTTTIMHNSTAHHGLPTMYRELNVARLRKATGDSASTIRVTNFPLPLTEQQNTIYNAIITVVAAIFVLIPFTFFPANCVAFVVKEREVKSKHIQNLSGIKTLAYWLATYIFDNLTMLITTILTLMVFVIFDREDVTGDFERMSGALLLFVVYGLASIALGYCFSFLFNNHSLAQNVLMMVNFLFGFVLVLASQVMNSLSQTRGINKRLQYIYRCIPAYSLGEGIIRLSTKRLLEFVDGQEYAVLDAEILGRPLLYMAVMAPFLFALAVFIDSSWFYKLKMKFRRNCHCCTPFCNGLAFVLCCGCCRVCCKKAAVLEDEAGPDKWETAVVEEDADVTAERLAVEDGDGREGDKVTIQHLKKVYDAKGNAPPKTAVHDLSLGVMKDEIFALLGSNGAGKTTTLSMMSGEFPPTGRRSGAECSALKPMISWSSIPQLL